MVPLSGVALVEAADALAARYHAGQVDKGGRPYIEHPRAVASHLTSPTAKAVALLHDVIEDTEATADGLLEAGMPPEVVSRVVILSRLKGESYDTFIGRVLEDALASLVKVFDVLHNLDPDRAISPADSARLTPRYIKALTRLLDKLATA